jgi:F-type H+-transporting ATPase subunit a
MPQHESWLSLAFPGLFDWIAARTEAFNAAMPWNHGASTTWMAHEHYGHGGANVQHVAWGWVVLVIIAIMGGLAYRGVSDTQAAIVPEDRLTVRTFVELFTGAVYKMMSDVMGKEAAKAFLPLIGTCAFFIFISNVIGMFPGVLPPTESLKTTVVCAVIIFLSTHYYGLRRNGLAHVKHLFGPWLGPIGIPLNILMFVIEIIGHLARPLSLSLRLMANIFADHLVLAIFATLVPWFVPLPVLPMLLGTMVVVVQTLVFCLLSTVYIGMAIESHDHGHDDHDAAHAH